MESKEAKPKVKKGLWKPEEDLVLKTYVETHGEGNWSTVSKKSGLMRGGKSCRLRWKNYLRPNIKRGGMSQEEEDMIIRMHKLLGNRWSLIAGRLPGRTDNEVKNYWNTHLNKRLPSGKRMSADSTPDQNDSNTEENKSKRLRALGDSQPAGNTSPAGISEELEGKNQEKEERIAVSDVRTQQAAQSMMNYYIESPILEGKNQEKEERSAVSDVRTQQAAQTMMNYYIESPMVPDNNATFVFDDEPFLAYWDSFVLFESIGCGGEW